MTIQWLLIVITASRLYIPIGTYDTQSECTAALAAELLAQRAATETMPSASLDCVLVTIKEPKEPRSRRKKKRAFL